MYNTWGCFLAQFGWKKCFIQKSTLKWGFLLVTFLDHLTSEAAGTHNFKGIANFHRCFEKFGTSSSKWAMGKASNFNIVRSAGTWKIFRCGHEKMLKTDILHKTLIPRYLLTEKISRIGPWKSWRPELSENVELIGRVNFLTGVIAAQSQKTVKFWLR